MIGLICSPDSSPLSASQKSLGWLSGLNEKIKGVKVRQCNVDWRQTRVAGDLAYDWGINTETVSVPDRPEPVTNQGKITLILRRQSEGSWKLALESSNDTPQ